MLSRVALLGCGFGRAVHAQCVQNHPLLTLNGVYSRRLEKAKNTAKEFGAAVFTDRLEELIESEEYDLYIVALPPLVQVDVVIALLKAGRAVFAEKPLGGLPGDLRELLRERNDVKLLINYEFSQIDLFKVVGTLIAEGKLGDLQKVSVFWSVQTYTNRMKTNSWKRSGKHGGGALNSFVSHVYHYLLCWMGKPSFLSAHFSGEPEIAEQTVISDIQWGNAQVHVTVCTDALQPSGQRIEILGESGSVVLSNTSGDPIAGFKCEIDRDGVVENVVSRWTFDPDKDGRLPATEAMLHGLVEELDQSRITMNKLKEALFVEEMLLAARRSAALGGQRIYL